MKPIRTILCPTDFSPSSVSARALAADVAIATGARLVLHHNLSGPAPGVGRSWEWEKEGYDNHESSARELIAEAMSTLPSELQAEARLTRGPLFLVVRHLTDELQADLVVLACHGQTSEDHASLTERFVRQSPCPVLAVGETVHRPWRRLLSPRDGDESPLHPRVLVATDLTKESNHAVAYAFDLSRLLPVEIELVHVLPVDLRSPAPDRARETAIARTRLEQLVPEDLADRVHVTVVRGKPQEKIPALEREKDIDLLVVGEHAPSMLRRLFTRDTTTALIHRSECPVWMVPAHAA